MSIPVACPKCGTKLKAQEKHIGRKLACPKCKQPFVVEAPATEVVEPFVELPTEDATLDPLADANSGIANLGSMDLGDLGIGAGDLGDVGSLDASGSGGAALGGGGYASNASPGPGAGGAPVSNPYAQPAKRAAAPASAPAAKGGLSPKVIGLIAAGGVAAILFLGLIVGGAVWALRPSRDSATPQTAQANPATQNSVAPQAAPATTETTSAAGSAPEKKRSSEPPKFNWQTFVQNQADAGKRSFASLSYAEDGTPSISLATTDKKEFSLGPPRTDAFPDATGIPLASRPREWFNGTRFLHVMIFESLNRQRPGVVPVMRWHVEKPADPVLVQSSVDGEGYTLSRLKPVFSPTRERLREIEEVGGRLLRSDHHHLWSPDGSSLYVLGGTNRLSDRDDWRNLLLKINTEDWSVDLGAAAQLPSYSGVRARDVNWIKATRIMDLAWSSEGLVAVVEGKVQSSLASDAEGTIWFPLATELNHTASLVVLDPATLKIKQAWTIPSLPEISGTPNGPLVYLQNRGEYMCVINVQSGELVNMVQRQDSMQSPVVTADGSWLLSFGANAVNRFRLEGHDVVFDQTRPNVGNRGVIVSSDGNFVSFHGRDKYYAVKTGDFSETVGTATGGDIGQIALDSVNRTVFVCSLEEADKKVILQVNREENPLKVELESISDDPSGGSPRTANPRGRATGSKLREEVWPLGMSTDPTGRGVIIFVEDGAYWFESRT